MLKQADVVLAMFLQGERFTLDEKRRNFDYYDPITTGDSSLSAVVQSIMAAEVGLPAHVDGHMQEAAVAAFSEESYRQCEVALVDFRRARDVLLDRVPELGWGAAAPAAEDLAPVEVHHEVGHPHFTGHGGVLDLTLANPEITFSGNSGSLIADVTSNDTEGNPRSFGRITVAGDIPESIDGVRSTPRQGDASAFSPVH